MSRKKTKKRRTSMSFFLNRKKERTEVLRAEQLWGDIRFQGLITHRGLRLIALICMTIAQVSTSIIQIDKFQQLVGLSVFTSTDVAWAEKLVFLGQMTFPLLLIATISIVLVQQDHFIKMLISYFVMALLVFIGENVFFYEIVNNALYDLPSKFPAIEEVLDSFNLKNISTRVVHQIVQQIIPGDGVVHIDALEKLIGIFGKEVHIYEMLPKEEVPSLITAVAFAILGQMDSLQVSQGIIAFFNGVIGLIPSSLLEALRLQFTPVVASLIAANTHMNFFWDLFLFSCFFAFIIGRPKIKNPAHLLLFRCCSFFPALWLIISAVARTDIISMVMGSHNVPLWLLSLFTKHNYTALIIFFLLILFEKYEELNFKYKHPGQDVREYIFSRNFSLRFSVYCCMVMVFTSILDYVFGFFSFLRTLGFGQSYYMWVSIPLLLVFSLNKRPKHKILNGVIPVYYLIHYLLVALISVAAVLALLLMASGQIDPSEFMT